MSDPALQFRWTNGPKANPHIFIRPFPLLFLVLWIYNFGYNTDFVFAMCNISVASLFCPIAIFKTEQNIAFFEDNFSLWTVVRCNLIELEIESKAELLNPSWSAKLMLKSSNSAWDSYTFLDRLVNKSWCKKMQLNGFLLNTGLLTINLMQ